MATTTLTAPLDDPKVLADWRAAIEQDERFDDGKDAEEFTRFYEGFLKRNPTFATAFPDLATEYEDIYGRALWLTLPYLGEKDGYALFESRLAAVFRIPDYDLWEHCRKWLINFPVERRDEIKKRVQDILTKSAAPATASPLVEGEASTPGTVGNWLRQYRTAVGTGQPDPLAQSQYFFGNRTFTAIPPAERETLQRLFAFADRLKLSSLTPEGFEEDIVMSAADKVVTVSGGSFLEPSPETVKVLKELRRGRTPEDEQARLLGLLKGSDAEAEAVRKLEEEYASSLQDDPAKLRDALAAQIAPVPGRRAEPARVVALLKRLARAGKLDELLRLDKRFFDLLAKRYQASGEAPRADDLKVYPTSPDHVSALLQLLLEDTAGFEEADAARVAVQLGNIMKKQGKDKYLAIAHFDEDADAFRFAEPLKTKGVGE